MLVEICQVKDEFRHIQIFQKVISFLVDFRHLRHQIDEIALVKLPFDIFKYAYKK